MSFHGQNFKEIAYTFYIFGTFYTIYGMIKFPDLFTTPPLQNLGVVTPTHRIDAPASYTQWGTLSQLCTVPFAHTTIMQSHAYCVVAWNGHLDFVPPPWENFCDFL